MFEAGVQNHVQNDVLQHTPPSERALREQPSHSWRAGSSMKPFEHLPEPPDGEDPDSDATSNDATKAGLAEAPGAVKNRPSRGRHADAAVMADVGRCPQARAVDPQPSVAAKGGPRHGDLYCLPLLELQNSHPASAAK